MNIIDQTSIPGEAYHQFRASVNPSRQSEKTSKLGLAMDMVRIVEHDPDWSGLFQEEQAHIRDAIGSLIVDIQHVGSTAVPGLPAKPVIDIAVVIRSLSDIPKLICALRSLHYHYMAEIRIPGELFFRKAQGTHHLHVLSPKSDQWENYLLFRDYLIQHPETARRYAELKRSLASEFASNRPAYTRGKAGFIEGVLKEARNAKGSIA